MTKKAIISTHDGREATIVTKASNVLFEDGQTAQDILNDRQDTMITPIITTSTSMSKVGQGDSVDYSENVVDGAYESCVLKGNTKVNLIQESSKQDVVLPYEFTEGQSVTISDTKESGALSVELKGQTLVNLYPNTEKKQISATSHTGKVQLIHQTEVDKTYLFAFKIEEINLDSNESVKLIVRGDSTEGIYSFTPLEGVAINSNGTFYFKWRYNGVVFKNILVGVSTSQNINSPSMYISNLMLIPYQEGMENWDIPYFEGMKSVQAPSVTTVGKNLFDINGNINQKLNYMTGGGGNVVLSENSFRADSYSYDHHGKGVILNLKPNTTYTISGYVENRGNVNFMAGEWNPRHRVVKANGYFETTYTPADNEVETCISFVTFSVSSDPKAIFSNIQIEESTTPTTYEPYKSSILSLPEEAVLRSLPNGVCDTFNTRTGVYTQRIGEVVLNGSEDWILGTSANWYADGNTFGFYFNNFTLAQGTSLHIDKFLSTPNISTNDMEGCYISTQWSWVGVRICKTKLPSLTVDAFKQWLSQNPITIQYELAEPIITKFNLPSTLKSWNTTTHIYSEIPENTLHPILSHSNPTYPVILKPSTKYSIVVNSYSNSHTNSAINFNLGGATASTTVGNRVTTITTPSTLSNELLIMSGRGNKLNNVMVIEEDVVGDEPYFEGICDCKSPILSNCGKNLCDLTHLLTLSKETVPFSGGSMGSTTYSEIEQNSIICTTQHANWWQYNIYKMKVKPNTTYHVSWTREVITSPTNGSNRRHRMYIMNSENETTSVTDGYKTTTLGDGIMYFVIADESGNGGGVGTQSKFTNVQIVEGGTKTTYEDYKSNILSCNGDKIELTEDMLEQGGFSAGSMVLPTYEQCKTSTNSTIRMRSKELIKVSPNTTYIVTNKTLNLNYTTYTFDSNKHFTGEASTTNAPSFTTSPSCQYIAIMFSKGNNSTVVTSDFKESEFQIYEVDKTIVLRSLPNGVCDTLDLMTGEYVQRIGEVRITPAMMNSTEYGDDGNGSYLYFAPKVMNGLFPNRNVTNTEFAKNIVCAELPTIRGYGDFSPVLSITQNEAVVIFKFPSSFYSETSNLNKKVDYIKNYVQKVGQLTFQYRLATPVIKTVDVQGFPYAYKDGHIQSSSGSIEQSLTPKVEYLVATNRNGQIRSNQKMVERHQKQLDQLQAIILANLVNSQYNQTLTTLNYELSRV